MAWLSKQPTWGKSNVEIRKLIHMLLARSGQIEISTQEIASGLKWDALGAQRREDDYELQELAYLPALATSTARSYIVWFKSCRISIRCRSDPDTLLSYLDIRLDVLYFIVSLSSYSVVKAFWHQFEAILFYSIFFFETFERSTSCQ